MVAVVIGYGGGWIVTSGECSRAAVDFFNLTFVLIILIFIIKYV